MRAHSCGPDVERGRCPNLRCFWDFGCSAVKLELMLAEVSEKENWRKNKIGTK